MRTVEFNCFWSDQNQVRPIGQLRTGKFHQWGELSEGLADGVGRWTIALVEGEDGQMYRVPPECLRFTDKA